MHAVLPLEAAAREPDPDELDPDASGDAAIIPRAGPLERSQGAASLAFRRRGAATVLDRLDQRGCAKIRLPRGEPSEAVLINTAGGLTGGDRLDWRVRWGEASRAVVTSQAAEKLYRSSGGKARIRTRLEVAAGAFGLWLPQETILFNRARLDRRSEVAVAEGGRFLGVEALVFGRHAMGETVATGLVHEGWRLRHRGQLVLAEDVRLEGAISERLDRPAIAGGARATATLLYLGEDAASMLDPLRAGLREARGRAAASRQGPLILARFLAADGFSLRRDLAAALLALGHPLPKSWRL